MRVFYFLSLALLLGGCSKDDNADATPDPTRPILDAGSTKWERVGRVPITASPGINYGNAMTAVDLQLAGDKLRVLYRENTNFSGTTSPSFFKAEVPASGTAAISALPRMVEQARGPGGTTEYENFFFFRPGTFEAYQGLNSMTYGTLGGADSQILTETGQVYSTGRAACSLSSNGPNYAGGIPQMLADGSVLYSLGRIGSGFNGNYWLHWLAYYRQGRWTYALSSGLSAYTPHTSKAFQAVRLPSGRLTGMLKTEDNIAVADTAARTTRGGTPTLPQAVAATFAGHQNTEYDAMLTRVVGNAVVFATYNTQNAPFRFSAYRWQEGSAAIEQLYANVELPATTTRRSECQLDDAGAVYFFARQPMGSANGMSLVRVDQRGAQAISPAVDVEAGGYAFSCPRLLGGQWYAAVGPTFTKTDASPRYMDLVRLKM